MDLYFFDLDTLETTPLRCIDGTFTFEEWGVASGQANVETPVPVGGYVLCASGMDDVPTLYFIGIVTRREYDHKRQLYSIELKDYVGAALDGEVEYTAEGVPAVLAEILADYAGAVDVMSSLSLFGTFEDPVQWVDLVKTVSLAEGKYLAISPEGYYILNHGDYQGIVPITPLSATTRLDMDRYGNSAVVTIDADWTEEATVTHQEIENGVGVTRTVTKMGERPLSAVTSYEDGSGMTESWEYDAEGNVIEYETVDTSTENDVTVEEVTTVQTWDLGENGVEHTQTVTVRQNYDPYSQWSNVPDTLQNVNKTITVTRCGYEENSMIRVYEEIYTYNPAPDPGESEWELWEKGYKTGVPDAAGFVGSSVSKYYRYVIDPVEGEWWALNRTDRGGPLTRPATNNKVLAVNKIGKHFSSTANDDASIDAIGEYLQEFEAFGLTAIEDVEAAASNYLTYSQRANTAQVEVAMQPFCVGDLVSWNSYTWTVEQVDHDLRSWRTTLKITRAAGLMDVQAAVVGDTQDVGRAIIAAIEKKGKRLHNAARAQVVAQIDYETYQVHLQGDPAGKTRIARVDYQKGVSYRPGKEVLLVRPTGKNSRWEIVSKRHEEPTTITTVDGGVGEPYIPITTSVSLGRSVYLPSDTLLMRVTNLDRAVKIQASWGDEGEEVIREYDGGGGAYWPPAAANPEYENVTDELVSGYNSLYLVRDILAPLDPETNPVQECSGKIRLQGAGGEWTDWETFSYTIKAPQITKFEYTLGTPYTGDTPADTASSPVVDCDFNVKCDFSPLLVGMWRIQYGTVIDGVFYSGSYSATGGSHFVRYDLRYGGGTPLATTGVFQWRFSADGENWHAAPAADDLFVQVGNGVAWSDALEAAHGATTSYNTFGEINFYPGDGRQYMYDWYAMDKDEDGEAAIGPFTYRLGHHGPSEFYSGSTYNYDFGPAFPATETEYRPKATMDKSYGWMERGGVV